MPSLRSFEPLCWVLATLMFTSLACGDEEGTEPTTGGVRITSTPPEQATELVAYSYDVVCTGPAQVTLTLEVGASDTCRGDLEDGGDGTGVYRFTPGETRGGQPCILDIVCTGGEESAEQTTTVDTIEVNQPPTITNLPATESGLRFEWDTYDVNASDLDIPSNRLSFSLSGDDCSFALDIDEETGEMTWICSDVESCQADVTVTDDAPEPSSDEQTLSLQCLNSLPEFTTEAPQEVGEYEEFEYFALCIDSEGDELTLGVGGSDTCGGTLSDYEDGSGTYSFTPDETQGGAQCVVHLTCSDGQDAESQVITVDIIETNQAPVITNLPHTETGLRGEADSYTVEAIDADLPADDLNWYLTDNTCRYTLSIEEDTGLVTWTYREVGTCTVRVKVNDDHSPSARDIQTLTLRCDNAPPTFTSSAPTGGTEGSLYTYDMVCTDPQGDPVELDVHEADTCGGSLVDHGDGTGTYTCVPAEAIGGTECLVAVSCDDPYDRTVQATEVLVAEVNEPPEISNLPAMELTMVEESDSFDVDGADPDLPPNDLTWSIASSDCSFVTTIDADTGIVTWTCDDVEVCTVEVNLADDGTPVEDDDGPLTITCSTGAPIITSDAPKTAQEQIGYTYDITCLDPSETGVSLTIGGGDTCAGILTDFGGGSGQYTFTPSETQGGGTCDVQVVCVNMYDQDVQTTNVSVNETNQAPEFQNLPTTIGTARGESSEFIVSAFDPDIPVNSLLYELYHYECTAGGSGFFIEIPAGSDTLSYTCGDNVETCTALMHVQDDGSPPQGETETLTIECQNLPPWFFSYPSTVIYAGIEYTYNIECRDDDGDFLILGRGESDTCPAVFGDLGGGLGTYTITATPNLVETDCVIHITCADDWDVTDQIVTIDVQYPP